jgi:hypothetical protein
MDFYAIVPGRPAELLMRVVDDQVIIVPPAPSAPRVETAPDQRISSLICTSFWP